ncbi:MAG: ribosome biogenesis GTPase Der [Sulfuriflexus sp.]|nr:ribosome biogenesis GTPase Der [Sulfuriflexus sp.]
MKPVLALVGRPNVGKSTLFNRLTRTRDAIVADQPGMTRDRKYGTATFGEREMILIDTGGLSGEDGIDELMAGQAMQAIDESDIVIFLVDARDGLTSGDQQIGSHIRKLGKKVIVAMNKSDGANVDVLTAEFYALGLGEPFAISAAHGRGMGTLEDIIIETLPAVDEEEPEDEQDEGIRIAMIGRPNVGKSTLVNRILGEDRVLVYDMPGTTRDSISIPFERRGVEYTLIDTAGVRRRSKVNETVEKFSIIKTLQSISAANIVLVIFDAHEGITEQDVSLLGYALEQGRALVIAVNKWDGLESHERSRIKDELDRRLSFIDFADIYFISALHGTGVGTLFSAINKAYKSAMIKISTPRLTRILEDAVTAHAPPVVRGRRIKLKYAHQGGRNPPIIVIHGKQTKSVPQSYTRYLTNTFRKVLDLHGTPVRVEFKSGDNPFEGRRSKLTPRQEYKKTQDNKKKRFVKKHRS